MRGTERPARTHWTRAYAGPTEDLGLSCGSCSLEAYFRIISMTSAEQLIAAVDNVPLAVNVLAHLAQATSPALLWKEWKEKFTGLVQTGHSHKLSNLEYSIRALS
jgi:hypothetical protein